MEIVPIARTAQLFVLLKFTKINYNQISDIL